MGGGGVVVGRGGVVGWVVVEWGEVGRGGGGRMGGGGVGWVGVGVVGWVRAGVVVWVVVEGWCVV